MGNTIEWSKQPIKREYGKAWRGNRGFYEVRLYTSCQGVTVNPHYHAVYRRMFANKMTWDFIERNKTYRTREAAMRACESDWKKRCRSMPTNADADTKPKKFKQFVQELENAQSVGEKACGLKSRKSRVRS